MSEKTAKAIEAKLAERIQKAAARKLASAVRLAPDTRWAEELGNGNSGMRRLSDVSATSHSSDLTATAIGMLEESLHTMDPQLEAATVRHDIDDLLDGLYETGSFQDTDEADRFHQALQRIDPAKPGTLVAGGRDLETSDDGLDAVGFIAAQRAVRTEGMDIHYEVTGVTMFVHPDYRDRGMPEALLTALLSQMNHDFLEIASRLERKEGLDDARVTLAIETASGMVTPPDFADTIVAKATEQWDLRIENGTYDDPDGYSRFASSGKAHSAAPGMAL